MSAITDQPIREIDLSEPERKVLRQSIDLKQIPLGEGFEHAKTADEFQQATDRATLYARIFRATEDGRLPVDPSVVAEIERWRSGMVEEIAYEQEILEKIRAGEDGYGWDGMDQRQSELYQRGYVAELHDALATCEGVLARIA